MYLHCEPDGTVVYVGKGTPERAAVLSNGGRYRDHAEWLHGRVLAPDGPFGYIRWYVLGVSDAEALLAEERLIAKYRPRFNRT